MFIKRLKSSFLSKALMSCSVLERLRPSSILELGHLSSSSFRFSWTSITSFTKQALLLKAFLILFRSGWLGRPDDGNSDNRANSFQLSWSWDWAWQKKVSHGPPFSLMCYHAAQSFFSPSQKYVHFFLKVWNINLCLKSKNYYIVQNC